jgi:alpha/beta superfamily hydrolase
MEVKLSFKSGAYDIEALLSRGDGDKGAVITHPHPLYGGDMHNLVVHTVAGVCHERDYTTLRFNFRGVGRSGGAFDNGLGEQEDVRSALGVLKDKGIENISLIGYSFGAWINALMSPGAEDVSDMIMISPPVAFIDFEGVAALPRLRLAVSGTEDEIAPADMIEKMMPRWNRAARFEPIAGADHFYSGYLDRLESILASHL